MGHDMTRRYLSLDELRELILADIARDEWVTANAIRIRNRIGGQCAIWRVAIVLERLAADGELELKAGARKRYYRLPQPQPEPSRDVAAEVGTARMLERKRPVGFTAWHDAEPTT